MFTWFDTLLASSASFMPHGDCYLWLPAIVWLHVISDASIAIAYFSIPFALGYFVKKRTDLAYRWVFILFGVFILLCGMTHIMGIWTIWHPDYWLDGLIKAATATVSLTTALLVWPLIPTLLRLPSPEALKTSEAFMRVIFNATPDAMLVSNANGIITMANQKAEALLGYSIDELLGQAIETVIPPRFREAHSMQRNRFYADPKVMQMASERILRALKKDQTECDVEITLNPIQTEQGLFVVSALRDVTLRKQAEVALKSSEERLTLIQSAAHIGTWDWDLKHDQAVFNPQFYALFGLPEGAVFGYSDFLERLHPDDRLRLDALIKRNQAEAIPDYECEYRVQYSDGQTRWMISKGRFFFDDGYAVRLAGIVMDITERKMAEEELKYSEALLQEAQQIASIVHWQWDVVDNVLNWSPEMYPNHERDALLTRISFENAQRHYTRESWERLSSTLGKALVDGLPFEFDAELVNTDGSLRWSVVRGTAIKDATGKVIMLRGTSQDITDRKATEAELHKLAQAVEQSPESIMITNLKAEIEYVNSAFSKNSGYSAEEVIGRNPRLLKSGKTADASYKELWHTIMQGQTWKGEFYNRRKDGSEYIEFAIITPIRQVNGKVTHYVSVQEDISEKKAIADELNHYRFHLEDLVASRTAELEAAKQQADIANQAKSAFLANMSHEIRTPMNAILGLTYLLQKTPNTPEQMASLNKIDASAQHLLSILNDVLDLSKIEAGHFELERQDFTLSDIVEQIRAVFTEQAAAKGIVIHIDTDHVPLLLNGDCTRLRQALFNYIRGCCHFT